ncbi:aldehyde oxidase 1 [Platysternon megacephalum]|uniref:Aldehyde oxidase 1 n=1 Tax=Platysternon megacephalum TaxID=55544 RepID=A0A4D9F6Y5_9SAUR|nr:aldehyde oxidase 1 [Platysternon megacephalum]
MKIVLQCAHSHPKEFAERSKAQNRTIWVFGNPGKSEFQTVCWRFPCVCHEISITRIIWLLKEPPLKDLQKPSEVYDKEAYHEISKPLMEKKRRARINVSLEQLKALLEKHYSHHIRKRKLEKADILELSVKYMKSLQNSVQGKTSVALPFPRGRADYQAGFRSCLHGVNQFLLRSEGASEASSLHLLQELARAAPLVSGSGCRTTDSSPLAPRPEPRGALQKGGGSTQRPRAPGAPRPQPRTEPGAAAPRRGPVQQRPAGPSRSPALWRPW